MTTLPPEIIKKIMKEYHSHPVADLLRAQVTFFPSLIPHDQDVICIGTHDGNHMYAPYHWSTKEHECLNYSMKIEEAILMNKLIDIMIQADVKPDDLHTSQNELHFAIGKLDDMYYHVNKRMLIFIFYARIDILIERFNERLSKSRGRESDGEESFVSSTVYSELQSDPESD